MRSTDIAVAFTGLRLLGVYGKLAPVLLVAAIWVARISLTMVGENEHSQHAYIHDRCLLVCSSYLHSHCIWATSFRLRKLFQAGPRNHISVSSPLSFILIKKYEREMI